MSDWPYPIPVVRVVVHDDAGWVLVLRRPDGKMGAGLWTLPGGKVERGQTVDDAARREVLEETGLAAGALTFLFHQDSLPAGPGAMHCINLVFAATAMGTVRLNAESTEARWITRADMDTLAFAFRNGEALRRYFDEFAARAAT